MEQELIIKNSHKRSKLYGIKRELSHTNKILNKYEVIKLKEKNKDFIEISKVYIDMVYSVLKDKDFMIILTDRYGCILYINGDFEIVEKFKNLNILVGAYMDEKSVGTNAMGTALSENKSVQITANEHYADIFQKLTCSAAPIHDENGNIIGTLNLTGASNKKHPHTLGLVIFAVKAIENEIIKFKSEDALQETYNYMKSIIDNVDKGLMIVSNDGKIKNINNLATNILFKDKEKVINTYIDCIVPEWNEILSEVSKEKNIITKEIKFKYNSKLKIKLDFKAIRVNERMVGVLITLMQEEEYKKYNEKIGAIYNFSDLIGDSRVIDNVIANAKIVANSPSTILIEGESGTGKEVLAQAIHNYSIRKKNKFIAINCGALPKNLIEAELFGYEDGTFTGGKKGGKIGKFELAEGGTLFLDEITEMSLDLQVILLRVLQEERIVKLGGEKEIPINVRIIAATNKNLKEEVKKGRFREDLYYRLCVIPITIPSLRERKSDIKKLIEHFLKVKSIKLNKPIPNLSVEVYRNLISYSWPGNVRQLENCIENIVNLDGNISFKLFEEEISKKEMNNDFNYCEYDKIDFNLEHLEKKVVIKAIKACNSNLSKTSKILGIGRNTLYSKIKKYDIHIEK